MNASDCCVNSCVGGMCSYSTPTPTPTPPSSCIACTTGVIACTPVLPPGTTIVLGSTADALWLQSWRQCGNHYTGNYAEGAVCLINCVANLCPLTSSLKSQIKTYCSGISGSQLDKIKCVVSNLNNALAGSGGVCKNHAICLKEILGSLTSPAGGISADLEATFDLASCSGHAWVESYLGTVTVVSDSYNQIIFTYP